MTNDNPKAILSREDYLILKAARNIFSNMSDEFNFVARRADSKVDMLSFCRTSERFNMASMAVNSALIAATHLAEQDSCKGYPNA